MIAPVPGVENSNKIYKHIGIIILAETPERDVQASFRDDRCFGLDAPFMPQRLQPLNTGSIETSEVAGQVTLQLTVLALQCLEPMLTTRTNIPPVVARML